MGREAPSGSGKHFYVKAKNLKPKMEEYPTLALQQKNKSTGNYDTVEEVGSLTGWITSIEKVDKPKTDKYKRIRGVKFTMADPGTAENYHFDLPYSNPVRELLNRMASLGSFQDKLKITFYRNKETGFAGGSLKKLNAGNEEKVEIKYPYKEHIAKRIKKVEINGEAQSDYTLVDEFFDSLIEKVLSKYSIINTGTSNYTPPVTENTSTNDGNGGASSDDDWKNDLPFRHKFILKY